MDNGASSYRRFLEGDESAFDEIMKELFDGLVFFIDRYVHDIHAAEDIAIDAFSDLVVNKHRYNFKVTLKTYLFMLGRSRALNYIKRRKIIDFVELSEAEKVSTELEALEETVLKNERKRIVNNALDSLPDDMRVVIHLIYFEDLSYDEAGKVMKKSRKQVDNLLYRAKKELRIILGKDGELLLCIPLCLIIAVWSVMVLPAMLPVNNKKSGATDERAENTSGAAYSQNEYVRIETKNSATKDQTAVLKDDPAEIAGVYRLVQSMLNNIVQTGEHKNEDQEGQQTSGSDAYDAAPVYMIIFTATDGGQTCYMLNDHILIDNAAKKETVLTEEQYVQLLQALGVVLKKEDGK